MNKIKIMFVCHGNICRSPMAEFVFKDMVSKQGLQDLFEVCSSATSTEEIWGDVGNPVYPPAKRELAKHGITCDGKRAVQLKRDDGEKYDFFVGMDNANVCNMHKILGEKNSHKISRLMDYTSRGGEVADPWYTGDFQVTYRDVYDGCIGLLDKLLKDKW
ncbi:MAG: low molecular weight phosphotyrosine protein phosphatase [Clostridiales bacterium]|nr:low molecular weight phosphotyrosine protein phosphatase [Clostridiales bacterium]